MVIWAILASFLVQYSPHSHRSENCVCETLSENVLIRRSWSFNFHRIENGWKKPKRRKPLPCEWTDDRLNKIVPSSSGCNKNTWKFSEFNNSFYYSLSLCLPPVSAHIFICSHFPRMMYGAAGIEWFILADAFRRTDVHSEPARADVRIMFDRTKCISSATATQHYMENRWKTVFVFGPNENPFQLKKINKNQSFSMFRSTPDERRNRRVFTRDSVSVIDVKDHSTWDKWRTLLWFIVLILTFDCDFSHWIGHGIEYWKCSLFNEMKRVDIIAKVT